MIFGYMEHDVLGIFYDWWHCTSVKISVATNIICLISKDLMDVSRPSTAKKNNIKKKLICPNGTELYGSFFGAFLDGKQWLKYSDLIGILSGCW